MNPAHEQEEEWEPSTGTATSTSTPSSDYRLKVGEKIKINLRTTSPTSPAEKTKSFNQQYSLARAAHDYVRGGSDTERNKLVEVLTQKSSASRQKLTDPQFVQELSNAFVYASSKNDVELLRAFVDHGINVNIKSTSGYTALMNAALFGTFESVCFLLDHNADVAIKDHSGDTALILACCRGYLKIAELLLNKNANPDVQSVLGRSSLMSAAQYAHQDVVQLLLNHNADIDLKNFQGKTALELAGNEEVREMLRNHVTSSYLLK